MGRAVLQLCYQALIRHDEPANLTNPFWVLSAELNKLPGFFREYLNSVVWALGYATHPPPCAEELQRLLQSLLNFRHFGHDGAPALLRRRRKRSKWPNGYKERYNRGRDRFRLVGGKSATSWYWRAKPSQLPVSFIDELGDSRHYLSSCKRFVDHVAIRDAVCSPV